MPAAFLFEPPGALAGAALSRLFIQMRAYCTGTATALPAPNLVAGGEVAAAMFLRVTTVEDGRVGKKTVSIFKKSAPCMAERCILCRIFSYKEEYGSSENDSNATGPPHGGKVRYE
jgi:hypothetical protein